jgi:hypothetical protein
MSIINAFVKPENCLGVLSTPLHLSANPEIPKKKKVSITSHEPAKSKVP